MKAINTRMLHFLAGIAFLTLAIITLRGFLFGDTLHNYRDDYEWFPDLDTKISDAIYTFQLEATRRIISLGPFLFLFNFLGNSILLAEKAVFLFTRFLMGFAPYLVVYLFLSSKAKRIDKNKIFVISIFSGFFYAYNPFATQIMGAGVHGFPFSYALIPLIFYFFDKTVNNRGFINIFITALLISLAIAETQQYLVWLPIFLLIPWFIIVIIHRIRSHNSISIAIKNSFFVVLFSFLISFYWILMAISLVLTGTGIPQPEYVLTEQMLASFSAPTTLLNAIRLLGVWWPYIELTPIIDSSLWISLTLLIPISMVCSILLLRERDLKSYSISFLLILLLVTFFYKGIQPPVSEIYSLLYGIPIVGWMFRVPERAGFFLPFFIMMIMGSGLYAFLNIKTNKVLQYFKVLPLLILIFSISLISWPMFTGNFGGIYKDDKHVVKVVADNRYNNTKKGYVSIPKETVSISGGYDKLEPLNSSGLKDLEKFALIFTDKQGQQQTLNLSRLDINKFVFEDGNELLPAQVLGKNSIILNPYDATIKHDPGKSWSKARTDDPLHGAFHDYLDELRVTNHDFDYGKGLVLTWAKDKLDIPVQIKAAGQYDLFIRYMKNPYGGMLRTYFDNENPVIKEITTTDLLTKFVWDKIGTFNLSNGEHTLELENSYGFNVVNIITLIPTTQFSEIADSAHILVDKKRIIHVLKGNSSFYNMNEEIDNSNSTLGQYIGTFAKTSNIITKVPYNHTQLSLEFRAKQNPDSASHYKIKAIEINPINNENTLTSNFEDSTDFELWKNLSPDQLDISPETQNPISGTESLRIDIRKANVTRWNIVGTNTFTPVGENIKLNFEFRVFATDVNALHAKVVYYDEKKNVIKADFLYNDPRNTYTETYKTSVTTPELTKYIGLEFWVLNNPDKSSYYLVDDVKVEQATGAPIFNNFFELFENLNPDSQKLTINNDSLDVDIKRGNASKWSTIETKPIPVNENMLYNYTITLQGQNIDSLQPKAVYSMSDIQKDKHVLFIGQIVPHFETFANVKLLKNSTYTIATEVKTCEECTSLRIKIGDAHKEFSLKNDREETKWFYFTANLTSGNTPLRIYSDGQTNLYKMIIYPNNYDIALSPGSETFNDIKLLKNSTYTIATEVKTCEECTSLRIKIGDAHKEFSLKNDREETKWFYFTANLTSGNTPLRIYSDGQTNLYKMIIFSDSHENETLNELFTPKEVPATVTYRNEVDPTHYEAKVKAIDPFVLQFGEEYNPSWIAHVNGNQYNSMELYPGINGFFIKEKGDLFIKIEYESQKWFYIGLVITTITIISSLSYLGWQHKGKTVRLLRRLFIFRSTLGYHHTKKLAITTGYQKEEGSSLHNHEVASSVSSNTSKQKTQPLKDISRTNFGRLIVRNIASPQFPIFIALILLIYVAFLLIQGKTYTTGQNELLANEIMTYIYKLLVVGGVWQFVQYLRS